MARELRPAGVPGLPSVPDDRDLAGTPALDQADGSPERRRAGRLSLLASCVVAVGVPVAYLATSWNSLTLPFWFNEYWRAYFISEGSGWWQSLKVDGAPFPAGWYFMERFAGEVFGSTELVLRLPTAIFLPIASLLLLLLARRWMPLPAALAVALVGTLTGDLLSYSVQLSEYVIDAAAVCAIVLLHELGDDANGDPQRRRRLFLCYAGMAVACLFSTPVVLVAGPLLVLDVVRDLRTRALGRRTIAAVAAGTVALVHLAVFVLRQNALTKSDYWDPQFLPRHGGLGHQISFVYDGLRGFVVGPFTDSYNAAQGWSVPAGLTTALIATWAVLLALGIVVAGRSLRGRSLLAGLGGSLLLTLVASALRLWPFGFVRVNLYEVPLLVLLAGIGATGSVRWTRERRSARRGSHSMVRRGGLGAIGAALALVGLAGLLLAGLFEVVSYHQLRAIDSVGYGARIRAGVAQVRQEAGPNDAVIIAGSMAIQGWQYYGYEYRGSAVDAGPNVPAGRVLYVVDHGSPTITRFIRRLHPAAVYLYVPAGTDLTEIRQDERAASTGGICRLGATSELIDSGLLIDIGSAGCPAG